MAPHSSLCAMSRAVLGSLISFQLIALPLVVAQNSIPLVCHDQGVQIIALAGTNVTNGTYGLGGSFINNIVNRIGNSDSISLNYNRFHSIADTAKVFTGEVTLGVGALQAALYNYTTACPNTPIVLHGYSEGGCVVANTICGAAAPWAASAPLAASYTKNIIAIIMYGEETRASGQTFGLGGCNSAAPHLARSNTAACAPFAPLMQSFCLPDDSDCCSTANLTNTIAPNGQVWHYQYPTYFDDVAANFIVSQHDKFIHNTTITAELPDGISEVGCFLDQSTRTLPVYMWTSQNNTAATCSAACRAAGYPYSGTENGMECYCGLNKPDNSLIIDGCWAPCAGDPIQACGNGWRINVYFDSLAVPVTAQLPTGVIPLGCYVDSSTRALPVGLYANSSNSQNTCALACRQAGYVYSGTENGAECYCGNVAPTVKADNSTCNAACPAVPYQNCGGGYRLQVLKDTTVTPTSSALPSGVVPVGCYTDNWTRTLPYGAYTNSTNTPSQCALTCRAAGFVYSGTENGAECWCGNTLSSTLAADNSTCSTFCPGDPSSFCGGGFRLSVTQDTTVSSATAQLPSGIVALGCYTDSGSYSSTRTLQVGLYANSSNSQSVCALACRAAGYVYSGTEYGDECFCDNLAPPASLAIAAANCSMPCPGTGNQVCGAGWILNIQQDTTHNATTTPLPAGWDSLGCYTDDWSRTLPVGLYSSSNVTDTVCINSCQAAGYAYAGTENGDECFCGSAAPDSSRVAAASDCRTACAGDATQVCGGGWRVNVFRNDQVVLSRRSLTQGRYLR